MKKIQLLFSHIKSAEEQVAKVNTMQIDVDGTLVALNRALENKKKLQMKTFQRVMYVLLQSTSKMPN